ncbi:Putative membrane protein [Leptospira santarosai]|uniref:Membrane protein n=1 Tax=Leptospira santarosai TaxID=28183 RepID=A0A2P1QYB5_9LEPT|nr:Putative membrane protein [Leptospira santarosai]
MNSKVWIFKPSVDLAFIILPGIVSVLFLFILKKWNILPSEISPWTWFCAVLLIDVAHVYSTLFRSYFNEEEWKKKKNLLISVPIVCFLFSILLYSYGTIWFWRIVSYVAVFHFIRQQFGFLALYRKKNALAQIPFLFDKITIYLMGGIPIVYWHFTDQKREFSWFIDGDFWKYPIPYLADALLWFQQIWLCLYILIHIYYFIKYRSLPLGKILLVINTWAVWFFGIVYFNSDFSFTITNVINHGVPYIFLLFYYTIQNPSEIKIEIFKNGSWVKILICFLCILFVFAFVEEWIWDSFIWKDHSLIFKNSSFYSFELPEFASTVLVSLLFLPQFTHYILDGYLWKIGELNPKLFQFFKISEKN